MSTHGCTSVPCTICGSGVPGGTMTVTCGTMKAFTTTTADAFVGWLRGFLDGAGDELSPEQMKTLREKLEHVSTTTWLTFPPPQHPPAILPPTMPGPFQPLVPPDPMLPWEPWAPQGPIWSEGVRGGGTVCAGTIGAAPVQLAFNAVACGTAW